MNEILSSPGWQLRRALELVCRKVNPPHVVKAQTVNLADLGLKDPDLSGVPLQGAYLRALDLGGALFGDDEGQLNGAVLEDTVLQHCGNIGAQQLSGANLLDADVPADLSPPEGSLHGKRLGDPLRARLLHSIGPVECITVLQGGLLVSANYYGTVCVVGGRGEAIGDVTRP